METIEKIEINTANELFCLRYELETLSNKVNFNKAERWVKGFIGESTELAHIDRYKFIAKFVEDKDVLDIACGSGYGTYMISTLGKAKSVIGVDLDEKAVKYGNLKYPKNNVSRIVGDATEFSYTEKFDCIVSFETIEHIPDYLKFIDNLHHNLKEDGELFISTPITPTTNQNPPNPYHVIEWNFFDFHQLFETKFKIENIYVQNIQIKMPVHKNSFVKKIIRKVFRIPHNTSPKIGKMGIYNYLENEFDMNKCVFGYQILKLKKK